MPKKPKPPATQSKLSLQGKSTGPNWDRARAILAGIKTTIRLGLAGQVLLGMELLTLKTELGFTGAGRPRKLPNDSVIKSLNRTWEQWTKSELGISPDGADNFIACYEAAKVRVRKLGGQPKLLGLLDSHPAKLKEEDHKLLSGMVDKLVWGETQKSLLEELKLVKAHAATDGGANGKKKLTPEQAAQQLAFAFFQPIAGEVAKAVKHLGSMRIKQDYDIFLHQLEVDSDDPQAITLQTLELSHQDAIRELQTFLADIRKAKAAKLKGNAA